MSDEPIVEVTEDGPYRVRGVPVVRTAQVETELGEPIAWEPDQPVSDGRDILLCRCGGSSTKPFCDGTHEVYGFDGTEVADRRTFDERRRIYEGDGLTLEDDISICSAAGYCADRVGNVWKMIERAADPAVRERIRTMAGLCPSGRLVTRPPGADADEPHLPPSVAVIADGPLWIRGGVRVVGADGKPYEVRNRQTLCRCGTSGNMPFCDGSHEVCDFTDG